MRYAINTRNRFNMQHTSTWDKQRQVKVPAVCCLAYSNSNHNWNHSKFTFNYQSDRRLTLARPQHTPAHKCASCLVSALPITTIININIVWTDVDERCVMLMWVERERTEQKFLKHTHLPRLQHAPLYSCSITRYFKHILYYHYHHHHYDYYARNRSVGEFENFLLQRERAHTVHTHAKWKLFTEKI